MKRKEFLRVSPESVGISSAAIHRLLDRLECGFTEMHSLQIMRHGKICAEGWWSPYAPGIRHNLMSVSKTYAATAVGIAITEGLISLSDRIVDIFPEESPACPDGMLALLTVRDVLCMGCGMDSIPNPTVQWIRDFIATPVCHTPGSTFMYNSMGSSLLGAIVKKTSGSGLHDYLKPRLFDKIGILADNLRWAYMPDGIEAGGAGLYAATEDNLRLMKLYADGGVWDGERILSEEYVKLATSPQIDSSVEALKAPFATDNFLGYGFQMWMCSPQGSYRADGAMGQYSIVLPRQNMLISINETGRGIDGPQKTLDAVWAFIEDVSDTASLPEDKAAYASLQKRLSTLSLPRPPYRPYSAKAHLWSGKAYCVTGGVLRFENQTLSQFCGSRLSKGIQQFSIQFGASESLMQFVQDGEAHLVRIATDGSRALNTLRILDEVATLICLSGYWEDASTFVIKARWLETSFEKDIRFSFLDNGHCNISTSDPLNSFGPMGELSEAPVTAIQM